MADHDVPANQSTIGGAFRFARDGYGHVESHALTTKDLENATVFGHGDVVIGSISNLVMGPDSKISHAIIDVGGFLGIGAHAVKLPFRELTVLRETSGHDTRINLDATKERLMAMPHETA